MVDSDGDGREEEVGNFDDDIECSMKDCCTVAKVLDKGLCEDVDDRAKEGVEKQFCPCQWNFNFPSLLSLSSFFPPLSLFTSRAGSSSSLFNLSAA